MSEFTQFFLLWTLVFTMVLYSEAEEKQNMFQRGETIMRIKSMMKGMLAQADAEAVTAEDGMVILMDEHLADSDAMDYDMDRADGEWALSDYVQKGIEVLDNDTGFFMMCEGGKIDWACHANDAGAKDKTIEWYSNDAGTKCKEFQYIPFGDDVMDEFGRFQPSPGRFPSSADGSGFTHLLLMYMNLD